MPSLGSGPDPALPTPYQSLQSGQWVKLICGASYQDMPTIRRLAMVYALAGVDCVDVAADVAVVAAARQGLEDAVTVARWLDRGSTQAPADRSPLGAPTHHFLGKDLPWLMVSLNDSEDPHFRKAFFDAAHCPEDCHRPCETICPTAAIRFDTPEQSGVMPDLCYGCGRCLTVCPVQNIAAHPYQARPESFSAETLKAVDAVEIHTQAGRQEAFAALWQRLEPWRQQLKLVSISCPDDPNIEVYLQNLHAMMEPLDVPLIWQTDGRSMSGDLGKGTTHATIHLAQKVLAAGLPGYVQLAGGTNHYTISKLRTLGLVQPREINETPLKSAGTAPTVSEAKTIAGIAYGSHARTTLMPLLEPLESVLTSLLKEETEADGTLRPGEIPFDKTHAFYPSSKPEPISIMNSTDALLAAIAQARQLVGGLKLGHHTPPH